MKRTGELRQRAERYRRLRKLTDDAAAIKAISEVAGELEMTAEQIERHAAIRERAHDLWVKSGRPEGRDVEFWLTAEREFEEQQVGRRRREA